MTKYSGVNSTNKSAIDSGHKSATSWLNAFEGTPSISDEVRTLERRVLNAQRADAYRNLTKTTTRKVHRTASRVRP